MKIADDCPLDKRTAINFINYDEFNRVPLADVVAGLLWRDDLIRRRIVWGIEGGWGSGKTTFKNFLVEKIWDRWSKDFQEKRISHPVIVNFDPWIFSNSEDLIKMLFSTISAYLSDEEVESDYQKRVKDIISKTLKDVSDVMDIISSGNVALKLIALGFKKISNCITPEDNGALDLTKAYDDLYEKLDSKEENIKIYVFIDEIDRLSDREIADIFKSIKSIGDLPNVVYVLLYDREVVSSALDAVSRHSGEEYLDKIVQVPIVLPAISVDSLYKGFLCDCGIRDDDFGIIKQVFTTYIKNKRDMCRLWNSFVIYGSLLEEDIDRIDLIVILSFNVFHPSLRYWVEINKERLIEKGWNDEDAPILNVFLKNNDHKDNSIYFSGEINMLSYLFPSYKNDSFSSLFSGGMPYRIHFRECFDRYFNLLPMPECARSKKLVEYFDVLSKRIQEDDFREIPHEHLCEYANFSNLPNSVEINVNEVLDNYIRYYPQIPAEKNDLYISKEESLRANCDQIVYSILNAYNLSFDDYVKKVNIEIKSTGSLCKKFSLLIHLIGVYSRIDNIYLMFFPEKQDIVKGYKKLLLIPLAKELINFADLDKYVNSVDIERVRNFIK